MEDNFEEKWGAIAPQMARFERQSEMEYQINSLTTNNGLILLGRIFLVLLHWGYIIGTFGIMLFAVGFIHLKVNKQNIDARLRFLEENDPDYNDKKRKWDYFCVVCFPETFLKLKEEENEREIEKLKEQLAAAKNYGKVNVNDNYDDVFAKFTDDNQEER